MGVLFYEIPNVPKLVRNPDIQTKGFSETKQTIIVSCNPLHVFILGKWFVPGIWYEIDLVLVRNCWYKTKTIELILFPL